jgi:beta-1,4-mannosyl-glycoprotein beta-1,4-N-acetylglucosaminyltransferase
MNRIFDCFCFFNELDLLEIRLNELNDVVDVFVLVEAVWTHQKKEKPLYYEINKERFSRFHSKIRHVIVNETPGFFYNFRIPNSWDFERFQKDQIKTGLFDCAPDDIIMISDVDEIPHPGKIDMNRNLGRTGVFQQRMYYYYLNCLEVEPSDHSLNKWWYGTVMAPYRHFKTGNKLRVLREIHKFRDNHIIEDAGWHFSFLGGTEKIIQKLESFAHTEFNKNDIKDAHKIKNLIESGKDILGRNIQFVYKDIDGSFPLYVRNNIAKLSEYILDKPF